MHPAHPACPRPDCHKQALARVHSLAAGTTATPGALCRPASSATTIRPLQHLHSLRFLCLAVSQHLPVVASQEIWQLT